jgi:MoaD family protein
MAITLKFLGALRRASGKETDSFEFTKEGTILELIDAVTKGLPELRRNLLDEHLEEPKANALIVVNGREISVLNGLKTTLKNGDEVVFVPVVHGG